MFSYRRTRRHTDYQADHNTPPFGGGGAINTNLVHIEFIGSRLACVDPEVKKIKGQGHRVKKCAVGRREYACRYDCYVLQKLCTSGFANDVMFSRNWPYAIGCKLEVTYQVVARIRYCDVYSNWLTNGRTIPGVESDFYNTTVKVSSCCSCEQLTFCQSTAAVTRSAELLLLLLATPISRTGRLACACSDACAVTALTWNGVPVAGRRRHGPRTGQPGWGHRRSPTNMATT